MFSNLRKALLALLLSAEFEQLPSQTDPPDRSTACCPVGSEPCQTHPVEGCPGVPDKVLGLMSPLEIWHDSIIVSRAVPPGWPGTEQSFVGTIWVCRNALEDLFALGGGDSDLCVNEYNVCNPEGFSPRVTVSWEPEFGEHDDERGYTIDTSHAGDRWVFCRSEDYRDGDPVCGAEGESLTAQVIARVAEGCDGWKFPAGELNPVNIAGELDPQEFTCHLCAGWGPRVFKTIPDDSPVPCDTLSVACEESLDWSFENACWMHGFIWMLNGFEVGRCVYANGQNALWIQVEPSACSVQRVRYVAHLVRCDREAGLTGMYRYRIQSEDFKHEENSVEVSYYKSPLRTGSPLRLLADRRTQRITQSEGTQPCNKITITSQN